MLDRRSEAGSPEIRRPKTETRRRRAEAALWRAAKAERNPKAEVRKLAHGISRFSRDECCDRLSKLC